MDKSEIKNSQDNQDKVRKKPKLIQKKKKKKSKTELFSTMLLFIMNDFDTLLGMRFQNGHII